MKKQLGSVRNSKHDRYDPGIATRTAKTHYSKTLDAKSKESENTDFRNLNSTCFFLQSDSSTLYLNLIFSWSRSQQLLKSYFRQGTESVTVSPAESERRGACSVPGLHSGEFPHRLGPVSHNLRDFPYSAVRSQAKLFVLRPVSWTPAGTISFL